MSLSLPNTAEEVVELLQLVPHPEGGFFRETFRSGTAPMTSMGQTVVDSVDREHLVTTAGRETFREDIRRNALTSIYLLLTREAPILPLILNQSSCVHNYHGGLPFEFIMYDPKTKKVTKQILGPNLKAGHVPQVIVEGCVWKTGRLLVDCADNPDYILIGESVAPGFDVADFRKALDMKEFPEEVRSQLTLS